MLKIFQNKVQLLLQRIRMIFSGEIKLKYRARTNSEQEKYNNETARNW
nr:hypothetical protein [Mycoplasmopsis bovis]